MDGLLRGRYRDFLIDGAGHVEPMPWRSNVVVYRALDLLAGLLVGQPGLRGILYWAVGEGDPSWDARSPKEDPRTARLVREIYRKPLDPTREIAYDPATRTLDLRITFGPGEGAGVLREFGLFGGDAVDAPDSGYLVNYKIHPAIDRGEGGSLERRLQFVLGPADG